jgi:vacuolar-type H+-ATPase subunit H/outer membrane murein-binding lipoprotein Lpp
MKKVLFFAVAALMLGLASCSETKKVDEAAPFIEQMKSQLEAGDVEELQSTMDNAMAKVSELAETDPEAAKTAFAEIQNFIKESKEQLLAAGTDEEALNYLIETPADMIINALTAGQSVINTAENLTDSVDQAINNKINELQEGAENTAAEQVEAAKQKAVDQVNAAKKEANDKVNEATQKANEEVNKAAEKANQEMNDAAKKALKSVGL